MVRSGLGVALLAAFVLAGTGCANKTNAELDGLRKQNDEFKQQLDSANARASDAERRASMASAQPAGSGSTDVLGTPDMGTGMGAPVDLSSGGPRVTSRPPAGRGGTTAALPGNQGEGTSSSINSRGEVQIEISGDVLFDSGKATLKPTAKKTLDTVAATLKSRYSGDQLRIEGHTDPAPVKTSGWDDNWDLGSARANAVRAYLETKGVKGMYIASFGASELKSTKNQALNRRVDIVVVKTAK